MILQILSNVLWLSFWTFVIFIIGFYIIRAFLRSKIHMKSLKFPSNTKRLAFFHPYCNSGGGGEKVLFTMISGLLTTPPPKNYSPLEISIYTGDLNTEAEILAKVERNFGLKILAKSINFIRVSKRQQCLDTKPSFTIIRQIIGSMIYTYKCINQYPPDLFFDTNGFPFSHWVVKMLLPSCKVLTYVHYPFISYDMLDCVVRKEKKFNNKGKIANSKLLSWIKVWYYRTLIFVYGKMGNYADLVFTNSSWTNTHIRSLWKKWEKESILLYPPCNIDQFNALEGKGRKPLIVSFAQFRQEKDHELQLEVFKKVKKEFPKARFTICGSCRDESDEKFLKQLMDKANKMELQDIEFKKNLKFEEILNIFSQASVGIHTMKAEHFGIAVVEMISAGLIVVAHKSAGPKYDIIKESVDNFGFLCNDFEDYVESVLFVLRMPEAKRQEMMERGRAEMKRFDSKSFIDNFIDVFYKKNEENLRVK